MRFIQAIIDTILILYVLGQYFMMRLGLRKAPPEVPRYYVHGIHSLDAIFGWSRSARVRGVENIPKTGPTILASNHIEIDDPFMTGALFYDLSGGRPPGAMMRDDFFKGFPQWARRFVDPDEVCLYMGAAQVSRQGATQEQIEQFVNLLMEGGAFLIYPGRTRSRTGFVFDYREWIRSPGRTSLFPSQVHEKNPELDVAVVPTARTYNLVTKLSCVAYGPSLYLERGASATDQREFDYRLVCAIADLIEVNGPQLISLLLYLRSLQRPVLRFRADELAEELQCVVKEIQQRNPARLIDPNLVENPEREVAKMMRYLRKKSFARSTGKQFEINREAVLSVPSSYAKYKRENPVKYLANQLAHMPEVISAAERRVYQSVPQQGLPREQAPAR